MIRLKKLVLGLEKNKILEPKGLASGKTDKLGKMIVDLEEDYDDESKLAPRLNPF